MPVLAFLTIKAEQLHRTVDELAHCQGTDAAELKRPEPLTYTLCTLLHSTGKSAHVDTCHVCNIYS